MLPVNERFSPDLLPFSPDLLPFSPDLLLQTHKFVKKQYVTSPELIELIEQEGATHFLVKIWVVLALVGSFCPTSSPAAPPLQVARQ